MNKFCRNCQKSTVHREVEKLNAAQKALGVCIMIGLRHAFSLASKWECNDCGLRSDRDG